MKSGIHPDYKQIKINCACGYSFEVGSTYNEDIRVEICSKCHPLYTGKSKLIDTAGRLERFQNRLAKTKAKQTDQPSSTKKQNPKKAA